jgi:hypothetical protein
LTSCPSQNNAHNLPRPNLFYRPHGVFTTDGVASRCIVPAASSSSRRDLAVLFRGAASLSSGPAPPVSLPWAWLSLVRTAQSLTVARSVHSTISPKSFPDALDAAHAHPQSVMPRAGCSTLDCPQPVWQLQSTHRAAAGSCYYQHRQRCRSLDRTTCLATCARTPPPLLM